MAVTVNQRIRNVVGRSWMDMLRVTAAGNDDPGTTFIHFADRLASLVPISASTGAGDMSFTFSTVSGYPSKGLITMTTTASTESAFVMVRGY